MRLASCGFSAIELVMVISIISLLAAIATPAVLHAAGVARLSGAADVLLRVHREARLLAMTRQPVLGKTYGMAIVAPPGDEAYVVVLLGTTATDILMADDDGDGQPDTGAAARPLLRISLPRSVEMLVAQGFAGTAVPFTGTLVWFYDWRTGVPLASAAATNPVSIGTRGHPTARATQTWTSAFGTNDLLALARPVVPPSPVCSELAVVARGTASPRIRVAIYDPGLGWRSEPEVP